MNSHLDNADDVLRVRFLTLSFVFGVTLFTSASLLFFIQPMIGKALLPKLGGTPAVWNTCLVFFQTMLLAGYWAVHKSERRSTLFRRIAFISLLVCAIAALPLLSMILASDPNPVTTRIVDTIPWLRLPPTSSPPVAWLLATLFLAVGLPFLLLSTLATTLQRLFSATDHPQANDPYFLYGVSNLGSMFALVAFPIFVEPRLTLEEQHWLWVRGFGVLAALLVLCFGLGRGIERPAHIAVATPIDGAVRFRWAALGFIPASLLYGVTTFLSTDVAAVPLLWIIPLALYLMSFILVFGRVRFISHNIVLVLAPFVILVHTFLFAIHGIKPVWVLFLWHLGAFFVLALFCHGELALSRPEPSRLAEFYVLLSLGGALGGVFNTFLAPDFFTSTSEYPLMLVLACFMLPKSAMEPGIHWADVFLPILLFVAVATAPFLLERLPMPVRMSLQFGLPAAVCYMFVSQPLRFGLGVGALLLAGSVSPDVGTKTELVHAERNFFGQLRVVDRTLDTEPKLVLREFIHGSTIHGAQLLSDQPDIRRTPVTYYFSAGPIGQFFETWAKENEVRNVAVLGLGAGALASFAEPRQNWTFFELDPAVAKVAGEYFDYLKDARSRDVAVDIVLGDGRLELSRRFDIKVDLLIADAFSSDGVPVHLLTAQALQLYLERLNPDGILVFNATNRFLDLEPVMAALAQEGNLIARVREVTPQELSPRESKEGKTPSKWVVMARRPSALGSIFGNPQWRALHSRENVRAWTDEYSNLWSVIRWE